MCHTYCNVDFYGFIHEVILQNPPEFDRYLSILRFCDPWAFSLNILEMITII